VPGVSLTGLGVPLRAAQRRRARRLAGMRADPGRRQLPGDIPPPGAPLQREISLLPAGEPPRQPPGQVRPVRRGGLPALHLPRDGAGIAERDLLPVNIEPACDGHRDLLRLPGARSARTRIPNDLIVARLS